MTPNLSSNSAPTFPQLDTRDYTVHGIRVSISSTWSEFLVLSELMFGAFGSDSPTSETLSAQVDLRVRGWFESPAARIERTGAEERLGSSEFLEGRTVRYAEGKIDVRYTDGRDALVRASYILDRTSRFRRIVAGEQQWGDQYELFRFAVQEPVLLKLERRGALLMHASAVARNGRSIIFLGLNGSGKSTLCARLLDRLDYVSDNFVAMEGTRVLGFPSAIRMPGSLPGMPRGFPVAHGKTFVRPDLGKVKTFAEAHALVFLSLGSATSLTRISPEEGFRRLMQIHDMTHEFPRHTYLGPLASPPSPKGFEALTAEIPSYRLVVFETEEARDAVMGVL